MVDFYGDVFGVAPGQSAVFYEGDDVVGGGIIQSGTTIKWSDIINLTDTLTLIPR